MQQTCGRIGVNLECLIAWLPDCVSVGVGIWSFRWAHQPLFAVGQHYGVGYLLQVFGLVGIEGGMEVAGNDGDFVERLEDGAGHKVGACEVGMDIVEDGVQHQVVVGGVMLSETLACRGEGQSRQLRYASYAVEDALLCVEVVVVIAVAVAWGDAVADFD